jgi:hypothetical protein
MEFNGSDHGCDESHCPMHQASETQQAKRPRDRVLMLFQDWVLNYKDLDWVSKNSQHGEED